jgi:hypothetical protein
MKKIVITESQYERLFNPKEINFSLSKDFRYAIVENELFDIKENKSLGKYYSSNILTEGWSAEDWVDLGVGGLSTILDLAGGATGGVTSAVAKVIDFLHSLSFIYRGYKRDDFIYKLFGFIGLASIIAPVIGSGMKTTLITALRPFVGRGIPALLKGMKNNKLFAKAVDLMKPLVSKIRGLSTKFDKWAKEYSWFGKVWNNLKSAWNSTVKQFDDFLEQVTHVKSAKGDKFHITSPQGKMIRSKGGTQKPWKHELDMLKGAGKGTKSLQSMARRATYDQIKNIKLLKPIVGRSASFVKGLASNSQFIAFLRWFRLKMKTILPKGSLAYANPYTYVKIILRAGKKIMGKPQSTSEWAKLMGNKHMENLLGLFWVATWTNHALCKLGIKGHMSDYKIKSDVFIPESTNPVDPKGAIWLGIAEIVSDLFMSAIDLLGYIIPNPLDLFRECVTKDHVSKVLEPIKVAVDNVGISDSLELPELSAPVSGIGPRKSIKDVTSQEE